MAISAIQVKAIAHLARLHIAEDEVSGYQDQLSRILEFVAQMNTVATDDVTPLAHPLELTARLRSDTVTATDQREEFQAIAPLVDSGYYLVPRVID